MAALLQSASNVLLQVVRIVMEFTPFGVFALIAGAVASNGVAVFLNIGQLALAVVIGSILQILVVHVPLVSMVARVPVKRFFRHRRCTCHRLFNCFKLSHLAGRNSGGTG